MSLFTRARRHVDMNRVKELREEKIKEEKIADIQKKQDNILVELKKLEIKEDPKYSNWRRELKEAMTSSGMFASTLPATGENINATINMGSADSFSPDDIDIPASRFGIDTNHTTSHNQPSNVFPGFSDGDDVLYFATPISETGGLASTPDYFFVTTNPMKLENDTLSFRAIAGNSVGHGNGAGMGSNGGTQPWKDLSVYWFSYDDNGNIDDAGLLGTVPRTTHSSTEFEFTFPANLVGKQVAINFFNDANQGGNESDSFLQGFSIPWHPLGSLDERGFGDHSSFLAWVILNYDTFAGQGYAEDTKQTLASSLWNDLQAHYTSTSGWNRYQSWGNPGAPAPVSGSTYAFGTEHPETFEDIGATTEDLDYIINWIETNMSHLRGQTTTTYAISSLNFKRKAPMNVFVPLDDPEASSFIRDGQTDKLSPADKKKKLEEQLAASKEYLDKMFGEGMPGTATEIADYEPQQSFADLAQAYPPGGPNPYGTPGADDPYEDGPFPDDPFDDSDFEDPFPDLPLASADWPKGRPGPPPIRAPWNKGWPTAPGGRDYQGPPGTPGGKYPMAKKDGKNKKSKQTTMVAHHEPEGKVLSEKKRLKSPKDLVDKIPGYYDGKPSPLGFPIEEPPKMKNGFHPDLVDGKKVSQRYNRLDPISARAMPKTGNPHIDKKVRAAAKKPK